MSKKEILDFQARWMRPAGLAAIAGAALLVASGIVGSVGSADDTAEQLELYQEHAGRFVLASVFSGLALLLFALPLLFLYRSALVRADGMRAFFAPLIALGTLLVAVQGVTFSLGLKDASDQYVAGVGAVEAKARQAPQPQPKGGATATTTTQSTASRVSDAKDNFAEDEVNDTDKVRIARFAGLIGALALVGSAVYTLVWAMRTGLLTRFMATLGMVFIAGLLLLPGLGPIGLVLWFAVLGLMLAGWWVRQPPLAWAAGEAVPWPKAGEDLASPAAEGPPGTVEGSGREVSEAPLPGNGQPDQPPQPPSGETQGQRRKKRKRRN